MLLDQALMSMWDEARTRKLKGMESFIYKDTELEEQDVFTVWGTIFLERRMRAQTRVVQVKKTTSWKSRGNLGCEGSISQLPSLTWENQAAH